MKHYIFYKNGCGNSSFEIFIGLLMISLCAIKFEIPRRLKNLQLLHLILTSILSRIALFLISFIFHQPLTAMRIVRVDHF